MLKTSKMKKRLSDSDTQIYAATIAITGLLWVFVYVSRTVSLSWEIAHVNLHIPTMRQSPIQNLKDSKMTLQNHTSRSLSQNTMTLILNDSGLLFGQLSSFTRSSRLQRIHEIPHNDRRPMIHTAIKKLRKITKKDGSKKGHLLFVPSPEWPVAIVVKLVQSLQESNLFDKVVLGSGFVRGDI